MNEFLHWFFWVFSLIAIFWGAAYVVHLLVSPRRRRIDRPAAVWYIPAADGPLANKFMPVDVHRMAGDRVRFRFGDDVVEYMFDGSVLHFLRFAK